MHLPRLIAATLAARQLGTTILPASYCAPECPSCKTEATIFNATTSCSENSTFITSCGDCRTCVIKYSLENPGVNTDESDITALITKELDQCQGTAADAELVAYQSQVTSLSSIASQESATMTSVKASATTTVTSTPITTVTPTSHSSWTGSLRSDTGDWTTVLSTATWASAYFSHLSEASVAATATSKSSSMSSSSVPFPSSTFTISTSATSTPSNLTMVSVPETTQPTSEASNTSSPSLNKTWIVGPVIGSLLGMSTVFIVIYFTRRKQHREYLASLPRHQPIIIDKYFPGSPTSSHNSMGDINGLTGGKAQLHGDSIALRELGNTEIMPPAELPAVEPVGSELLTPRGKSFRRKGKRTDTGEGEQNLKEAEDGERDLGVRKARSEEHEDEDENEDEVEDLEEINWPLPMSPLKQIFKSTEMRDGKVKEIRHETFYNP